MKHKRIKTALIPQKKKEVKELSPEQTKKLSGGKAQTSRQLKTTRDAD